jgi:4-amino-4-deoxy-L-arabinose transferase-like glycosyltransferase
VPYQRKHDTSFLLIVILLHLVWFGAGLLWQHFYNGDSYEYIYLAENMAKGRYYGANPLLPVNDFRLSLRTPLYSVLLLACYTLFGYHNWIILLLQNILSVASCVIVKNSFERIAPSGRYRIFYLLFLAFYPAQMFFADTLAPDTVLQFLLMLYFRQLVLSLTGPKQVKHIVLMSLWLLLATLTKPVVYPFLFLHFLYACWYGLKHQWLRLSAAGLLPILAMMGYGFWNKQRTGLFHISSIQSTNLLHYNVRYFLAREHGPAYADSVMKVKKAEQNVLPGLKRKYEYAAQEANAIIKAAPVRYGIFHLKESARFFAEPGKSELDLYTGYLGYNFNPEAPNFYRSYREKGIQGAWQYLRSYPWLPLLLLIFFFNIARLAGGILFFFHKGIPLSLRICITLYILYFAVITGPVANARYFLPVLPVLSGAAMLGYSAWIERRKNRKQKDTYAG